MVSLRLLGSPADSGTLRASLRKLSRSAICIAILAGAPGLGIRARAKSPTVEIDAVAKPFSDDSAIPANVAEAANFYQTHGLIHGRSLIRAADPKRTRIIGNFRRQYRTEPPECRHFPWYSRLFTKGHIEIECDPEVWSEVKTLLGPYLPSQAIRQNQSAAIPDQPAASVRELAEPEAIETFTVDSHRR